MHIKVITGIKNKNTPKLVATPFPPLKDIKQENVWAKIATKPKITKSLYFKSNLLAI